MQHEDAAPKLDSTRSDSAKTVRFSLLAACRIVLARPTAAAGETTTTATKLTLKQNKRPQCVSRPPLTEMRIPIHLSINELQRMRVRVRREERDSLQPEIRVGVSLPQFFSLFATRTNVETGHGCNCCRASSSAAATATAPS